MASDDDLWKRIQESQERLKQQGLLPTTTTTTVPSSGSPTTTVPSGGGSVIKPPILSTTPPNRPASVARAEAARYNAYYRARNAGVEIPEDLIPPGITPPEEPAPDRPWYADIGYGALNVGGKIISSTPVSWGIGVLTTPSRVVLSTAKELGEGMRGLLPQSGAGGVFARPDQLNYSTENSASFSDWFRQIGDFSFGFQEAIDSGRPSDTRLTQKAIDIAKEEGILTGEAPVPPKSNLTGNKWVDIVTEFAGEVVFDPLMYTGIGGANAAKTISKAGSEMAAREITEQVIKEGGIDALRNRLVNLNLDPADMAKANAALDTLAGTPGLGGVPRTGLLDDYDNALNKLGELKSSGGSAEEIGQVEVYIDAIGRQIRTNTDDLAVFLKTKGGNVVAAERARVDAVLDYVQKVNAFGKNSAEAKAAAKVADQATQNLIRQASVRGMRAMSRRSYRMNSREELAEALRVTRQFALSQLDLAKLNFNPLEELYQATVNTITDDLIKNVAVRGWNAIDSDVGRIIGAGETRGIGAFGMRFFPSSGSRIIERGIGSAAVTARLSMLKTPLGQRLIDVITPLGRRGIFAPADVLVWRRALRSGNVTARQATEYVALLDANKKSLSLLAAKRREYGAGLAQALKGINESEATQIRQALETGVRPAAPDVATKYDKVKGLVDGYYNEVNGIIKGMGGIDQPRVANYFPHIQTDDALRWIMDNPEGAAQVAERLGVNSQYLADNFIQRTLVEGSEWFGHKLTKADLDAGIDRLNWMARNPISGPAYTGTKEFFETDLRKALAGYAATHARYVTTLESLKKLAGVPRIPMGTAPTIEGATSGARELLRPTLQSISFNPASVVQVEAELTNLINRVGRFVSDPSISQYIDQASYDRLINTLRTLEAEYARIAGGTVTDEGISYIRFADASAAVENLRSLVDDLDSIMATNAADAATGFPVNPAILPLWGSAFDMGAKVLENYVAALRLSLLRVDDIQWMDIKNLFDEGFEALRLGSAQMPGIQVNKDYQALLNSVRRMNTQQGAEVAESIFGKLNTLFKSYVTASPGFVARNVTSNTFILGIADALNPNALKSLKYYTEFFGANRLRFIAGRPLLTPEEFVAGLKVTPLEKRRVLEALRATDTSTNIFAEVLSEVPKAAYRLEEGNRPIRQAIVRAYGEMPVGISGRPVAAGAPLETTRVVAGTIPSVFRGAGALSENVQRFMLTYDGLAKGLNRTEALTRTNKYLFDYSDLSRLDRVAKQFIPFWYWASRNFPLRVELMLTEPRVLSQYGSVKRFLEEDRQPENLPTYMKDAGVFSLREDLAGPLRNLINALPVVPELDPNRPVLISPDLGFTGAGSPNVLAAPLTGLLKTLQSGGTEDDLAVGLRQLIGATNPLIRPLIEYAAEKNLFLNRSVDYSEDEYARISAEQQRFIKLISDLIPVLPFIGRTAGTLGAKPEQWTESELVDLLLQVRDKDYSRMTPEQIARIEEQERERRLFQYLGSPIRSFTEQQELQKIGSDIAALDRLRNRLGPR